MACEPIRTTRRRLKNFTYGRQWEEMTVDPSGRPMTEGDLQRQNGRRPLTNNLLRSLVKGVVGRFRHDLLASRSGAAERGEADFTRELRLANQLDELDARALEEFLISGCVVQRVCYERRMAGQRVWVDNVNPDHFFVNRFLDPRGHDIRFIGMLHEMTLGEMKLRFGHRNRHKEQVLTRLFSRCTGERPALGLMNGSWNGTVDFVRATDPALCRVIEVWTLDSGRGGSPVWRVTYLGPDGSVLDATESPYAHGSHPFVVNFYPLTDGEVHPFIEDVIDQQRHINQLITVIDHILAHSAKGALLLPVDALPDGCSMEDAVSLWSRPGAVIPIDGRATRMPQEVTSPGRSEGASQLLNLEMSMFRQISGVSQALQGQLSGSNLSASLYDQQVQNSAIALLDIFETFNNFRAARDTKASMTVEGIGFNTR